MKQPIHKIIIGLIMIPIFASMYFLDRAILVFLPHIDQKTIRKWFNDTPGMLHSVIRVTIISIIWLFYELIMWRING